MLYEVIVWVIFGAIAGWIASLIAGVNTGLVADIVIGIVGAVIGGFILRLLGIGSAEGFNLVTLVAAIGGAVILLGLMRLTRRQTV